MFSDLDDSYHRRMAAEEDEWWRCWGHGGWPWEL